MERPILFTREMVEAILLERKSKTRRIAKNLQKCPYKVGDALWVKETYFLLDKVHYPDLPHKVLSNGKVCYYNASFDRSRGAIIKKPSLFMAKEMSRIRLEITGVRAERLQDISEQDAIAEGIIAYTEISAGGVRDCFKDYDKAGRTVESAIESYKTLWESINGKGSWEENPFVWVIEFQEKKCECLELSKPDHSKTAKDLEYIQKDLEYFEPFGVMKIGNEITLTAKCRKCGAIYTF